ncbi:MAG: hypothetical protein RhofKO_27630 [Rhodothermales bacterium]
MPDSLGEAILTASYRAAKQWRWRTVKLYRDRVEITSRGLMNTRTKTVYLADVDRADLVPKHGTAETVLVLRFADGSKEMLGIPGQGLWHGKINKLLGVNTLRPDRPLPSSSDEAADAA